MPKIPILCPCGPRQDPCTYPACGISLTDKNPAVTDDRAIAWAAGYRACLEDLSRLGPDRVIAAFQGLVADMRSDADTIERTAKGRKQTRALRVRAEVPTRTDNPGGQGGEGATQKSGGSVAPAKLCGDRGRAAKGSV